MHRAARLLVIGNYAMHYRGIVPYDEVANLPLVGIAKRQAEPPTQ